MTPGLRPASKLKAPAASGSSTRAARISVTATAAEEEDEAELSFAGFLPFLFSDKSRAAGGRETKRNGLSPDGRRGVGMTHKHSFSSSSSNDSDNGGRRETVNNEGTCDAGYRGKSSYHRQLATKRHSVTFGCLHELADMDHVESLMSVLEKADWLSSQEQLTNQTSGESANHGAAGI